MIHFYIKTLLKLVRPYISHSTLRPINTYSSNCFIKIGQGDSTACCESIKKASRTPTCRRAFSVKKVPTDGDPLEEVVGLGLLGGYAPAFLGGRLKDGEVPLQVLVQLQDGSYVAASVSAKNVKFSNIYFKSSGKFFFILLAKAKKKHLTVQFS